MIDIFYIKFLDLNLAAQRIATQLENSLLNHPGVSSFLGFFSPKYKNQIKLTQEIIELAKHLINENDTMELQYKLMALKLLFTSEAYFKKTGLDKLQETVQEIINQLSLKTIQIKINDYNPTGIFTANTIAQAVNAASVASVIDTCKQELMKNVLESAYKQLAHTNNALYIALQEQATQLKNHYQEQQNETKNIFESTIQDTVDTIDRGLCADPNSAVILMSLGITNDVTKFCQNYNATITDIDNQWKNTFNEERFGGYQSWMGDFLRQQHHIPRTAITVSETNNDLASIQTQIDKQLQQLSKNQLEDAYYSYNELNPPLRHNLTSTL